MRVPLLEEVRRQCRRVAERAYWVRIDPGALKAFAGALPAERLLSPEMDPEIHYLGQGAGTVAFCLILSAVNFGSGYFPDIFGPRRSGYRAVAGALTRHFAASGPLTPAALRRLSPIEAARIVGLDPARPAAAQLALLYSRALNDLGGFLLERCRDDVLRLAELAGHSVQRLVALLEQMPFYRDRAGWGGASVPFYKRAQLAAVDLHIAFNGEGPGRFDDLDRLTVCADNLVPHVLRLDGVLNYRETLVTRIEAGEPLAAGSPEEVEIRACAVHAGELIVEALRRRGLAANALLLDNLLWHRGQQPHYRARPRHRTRTVFY